MEKISIDHIDILNILLLLIRDRSSTFYYYWLEEVVTKCFLSDEHWCPPTLPFPALELLFRESFERATLCMMEGTELWYDRVATGRVLGSYRSGIGNSVGKRVTRSIHKLLVTCSKPRLSVGSDFVPLPYSVYLWHWRFIFTYVPVHLCIYVHAPCECNAPGSQKRVLELELQVFVRSPKWIMGTKLGISVRAVC